MYWGAMNSQMGWGLIEEEGWRKGPWTSEEDRLLIEYVRHHGEGRWNSVARLAGLKRNGKSCRLRWVNYLRPDLKRGQITPHEESIILELHGRWGNRWSTIARSLPGRTDNEIKNYWRTHFKKKQAKPFADSSERAKARLLKRQQFHQQQQQLLLQQQQQQQQQQQFQLNQMEFKRIIALLEEPEQIRSCAHSEPANLGFNPQAVLGEQGFNMDNISNNSANSSLPEAMTSTNEVSIWDYGLWNLEDFHGSNSIINNNNSFSSACSSATKANLPNLVVPFC